jgi:prevent-host-death family protein
MSTEIGAFEAKTKFSELLRKVEQGERFTVTVRGRAVAEILRAATSRTQKEADAAAEALMNFPRVKGIPGDTVLEWIRAGRK